MKEREFYIDSDSVDHEGHISPIAVLHQHCKKQGRTNKVKDVEGCGGCSNFHGFADPNHVRCSYE